jgi:hypothetical protein
VSERGEGEFKKERERDGGTNRREREIWEVRG